ncbi:uncharacterized protein J3D65DRAFT_429179 [Phyllosticta citribraziliensis]|uniref:Uncharacterized protein n=1 Tax=Phyllosticta citribraziliensis TaxID=989973 RepID=A0ABR1LIA0_9PEZI
MFRSSVCIGENLFFLLRFSVKGWGTGGAAEMVAMAAAVRWEGSRPRRRRIFSIFAPFSFLIPLLFFALAFFLFSFSISSPFLLLRPTTTSFLYARSGYPARQQRQRQRQQQQQQQQQANKHASTHAGSEDALLLLLLLHTKYENKERQSVRPSRLLITSASQSASQQYFLWYISTRLSQSQVYSMFKKASSHFLKCSIRKLASQSASQQLLCVFVCSHPHLTKGTPFYFLFDLFFSAYMCVCARGPTNVCTSLRRVLSA